MLIATKSLSCSDGATSGGAVPPLTGSLRFDTKSEYVTKEGIFAPPYLKSRQYRAERNQSDIGTERRKSDFEEPGKYSNGEKLAITDRAHMVEAT